MTPDQLVAAAAVGGLLLGVWNRIETWAERSRRETPDISLFPKMVPGQEEPAEFSVLVINHNLHTPVTVRSLETRRSNGTSYGMPVEPFTIDPGQHHVARFTVTDDVLNFRLRGEVCVATVGFDQEFTGPWFEQDEDPENFARQIIAHREHIGAIVPD